MTLKKAIEVLSTYQAWRIGEEDVDMQKPSVVTEALKTLLDFTDSPEFCNGQQCMCNKIIIKPELIR